LRNQNNTKSLLLPLLTTVLVVIISMAIIFINWSSTYSTSSALWGLLFGLPIGLIIGYFWNLLIFSLALPRLPGNIIIIARGKKYSYIFYVTILGIIINQAYHELIWDMTVNQAPQLFPAVSIPLQFILIIVPMIMLWLVNFTLSYSYLGLGSKQSVILSIILAFFTLSWLEPALPYFLGQLC